MLLRTGILSTLRMTGSPTVQTTGSAIVSRTVEGPSSGSTR